MIEMKDILVIVDVQKGFTKDYTVEKIPVIEDLLSRRLNTGIRRTAISAG